MSSTKATWYVYMLLCADDSIYTGITTNLTRRLREHNHSTRGARYTSGRRPVRLGYYEEHANRSAAAKREVSLRRLQVREKRKLMLTSLVPGI